jgi:hypothetical protein
MSDEQRILSHNTNTGEMEWYSPTTGELLLSHVEPDYDKAVSLREGVYRALKREAAIASARTAANIVLKFHESADEYL